MKNRKILGIFLILLGIAIIVSLISFEALHRYRLWSINDSGKAEEFPAFGSYLWNFSKGTALLSFVLGSIPTSIGIFLLRKPSPR